MTTRELRIVNSTTGEIVFRQDVAGLGREQIEDAAAKLKGRINEEEFHIEDSGEGAIGHDR